VAEVKKVHTEDGTDVTEAVQILYDIAHQSLDWGSGFLDNSEMEAVIRLAVTMGMQVPRLPGGNGPMVSLAKQFPEHYTVEEVWVPEQVYPNGGHSPAHTYMKVTPKS